MINSQVACINEGSTESGVAGLSTPVRSTSSEVCGQWPFQVPNADRNCPTATLPAGALAYSVPVSSPSKGCNTMTGVLTSTSPEAVQSPLRCEASERIPPRVSFASPNVVRTSSTCEASARTPPRVAFGGSPMACMTPTAPATFCMLTYHGGSPAYQGSYMSGIGSPCPGQSLQAPTFFACAPPNSPVTPQSSTASMLINNLTTPDMGTMRSWLTGGVMTSNEDLARRLLEAVPEAYED